MIRRLTGSLLALLLLAGCASTKLDGLYGVATSKELYGAATFEGSVTIQRCSLDQELRLRRDGGECVPLPEPTEP